ncbi:hypothetical protein EJB05_47219, partial [Eragrostis curvula]
MRRAGGELGWGWLGRGAGFGPLRKKGQKEKEKRGAGWADWKKGWFSARKLGEFKQRGVEIGEESQHRLLFGPDLGIPHLLDRGVLEPRHAGRVIILQSVDLGYGRAEVVHEESALLVELGHLSFELGHLAVRCPQRVLQLCLAGGNGLPELQRLAGPYPRWQRELAAALGANRPLPGCVGSAAKLRGVGETPGGVGVAAMPRGVGETTRALGVAAKPGSVDLTANTCSCCGGDGAAAKPAVVGLAAKPGGVDLAAAKSCSCCGRGGVAGTSGGLRFLVPTAAAAPRPSVFTANAAGSSMCAPTGNFLPDRNSLRSMPVFPARASIFSMAASILTLVEFPISKLQPSDVHAKKNKMHGFQRYCTLETELPWLTIYRLALLFFGTTAAFFIMVVLLAFTCLSTDSGALLAG